MNDFQDKQTGQPPEQRKFQTDISLDIERKRGIIPPFLVKQLFQQKPGEIFKQRRDQNGADKQQQEIFVKRLQKLCRGQYAESVDRTDRTVQETAVHEFPAVYTGKNDFRTPSEKAVY